MRTLSVFVQTCPGREGVLATTSESIAASDIGDHEVISHPEGWPLNNFFYSFLQRMAEAETEYVLRLEDDIFVNKHLRHNALAWPALDEEDFGAGWLFTPKGEMGPAWMSTHRMVKGQQYRTKLPLHGALACLFRTADLPALIEQLHGIEKEYEGAMMDLGVSMAVGNMGRKVFQHVPSLVEHNVSVPSSMGHAFNAESCTAGGLYEPAWKRS